MSDSESRSAAPPAYRVILAGPTVSTDRVLIQLLNDRHRIARAPRAEVLEDSEEAGAADLAVVECARGLGALSSLGRRHAHLTVLLVDGGLSLQERAAAFRAGIKDVFPLPYDPVLLAQRIERLCALGRRRRPLVEDGGAD